MHFFSPFVKEKEAKKWFTAVAAVVGTACCAFTGASVLSHGCRLYGHVVVVDAVVAGSVLSA